MLLDFLRLRKFFDTTMSDSDIPPAKAQRTPSSDK
jgi:hypothetical protein